MIDQRLADFIDSDQVLRFESGALHGQEVAFVGSMAQRPTGVPCYGGEELYEVYRLNGEDDALLRPCQGSERERAAEQLGILTPSKPEPQERETVLQWLHRAKVALGGSLAPTPDTVEKILGHPYLSREALERLWGVWSKPERKRYLARRDWAMGLIAACARRAGAEALYMTEDQAKLRAANYAARRTMREAKPGIGED